MSVKHRQVFHVNSDARAGGSNSNFYIELPVDPALRFKNVVVLQASIPKTMYLVQDDGRNTFTLTEGGSSTSVTVPAGSYNRKAFKTYCAQLLSAASVALGNTRTYTLTYPNSAIEGDNGKYTYTVSAGTEPTFTFGATSSVAALMGFARGASYTFTGTTLVSTQVANFSLESSIYIHSNLVDQPNNDILCSLSVAQNPFYSTIAYDAPNLNQAKKCRKLQGKVFSFALKDESGNEIDLNGSNWLCTIMLFTTVDQLALSLAKTKARLALLKP